MFPNFTMLSYGDQFKTYTDERLEVGTIGILPDGRRYRFVYAGAVALTVGKLMQAPIPITTHVLQTLTVAAAVGDGYPGHEVQLTLGAAAIVADQYRGGLLVVDLVGNTGFGYQYSIASHAAVALSGNFKIPLKENDLVRVAIATTANSVSVVSNPYRLIIISVATPTAAVVGVTCGPIPINNWGWIQTHGDAMVLTDNTTIVIGQGVVPSLVTAGAIGTTAAGGAEAQPFIGLCRRVAVSASYSLVSLYID
jgi:hypothetical protein